MISNGIRVITKRIGVFERSIPLLVVLCIAIVLFAGCGKSSGSSLSAGGVSASLGGALANDFAGRTTVVSGLETAPGHIESSKTESARFTLRTDPASDIDESALRLHISPVGDTVELTVAWTRDGTSANNPVFIGFEIGYDAANLYPVYASVSREFENPQTLSITTTGVPGILPFGIAAVDGENLGVIAGEKSEIALARAVFAMGVRGASRAAENDTSGLKVDDLVVRSQPDGAQHLVWTEKNTGDYDSSGMVGVADITQIALHFGETVVRGTEDFELLSVIDGDGSGDIGISDITPIATYYLSKVYGYDVFRMDYSNWQESWLKNPDVIAGDLPTVIRPVEGEDGYREGLPPRYSFVDYSLRTSSSAIAQTESDNHLGIFDDAINGQLAPNCIRVTSVTADYLYQLVPRQFSWNQVEFPDQAMETVNIDATIDPPTGKALLTVSFTIAVQGQVPPFVYTYDFDDGNSLVDTTNTTVEHTYQTEGVYYPSVTVRDYDGNLTTQTIGKVVVEPSGDIFTYKPDNVRADGDGLRIWLRWGEVTHPDVAGYNVYISDIPNDTIPQHYNGESPVPENTLCINSGIETNVVYYVRVTAVDISGKESKPSGELMISTGVTDAPPLPPTDVTAIYNGSEIVISWTDDVNADVVAYWIYRAINDGRDAASLLFGVDEINRIYLDDYIQLDVTNRYWISAVDNAGNKSEEVQVACHLPGPPKILSILPIYGTDGQQATFGANIDSALPVTYDWDFTNTATPESSNEVNPVVTFTKAGVGTVSLVATNVLGSDEMTSQIALSGNEPKIISVSPTHVVYGDTVTFSSVVTGSLPMIEYYWSIPGVASTDSETITAEIKTTGVKDCYLRVENYYGTTTLDFKLDIVGEPPKKVGSEVDTDGIMPDIIYKDNLTYLKLLVTGTQPMAYSWSFGDTVNPSTSIEAEPLITATEYGPIECSVTVSNMCGELTLPFELRPIMHGWETEVMVYDQAIRYPIIGIDKSDRPCIAYIDGSSNLALTQKVDSKWTDEIVATYAALPFGFAIDDDGFAHFSYTGFSSANKMFYVNNLDGAWSITQYDEAYGQSAIAIDPTSGFAHMSYRNIANEDLKYAVYNGSEFETSTIDSDGEVGKESFIAIGSDGFPRIAYIDDTNKDLKYASFDGASWNFEVVDSDKVQWDQITLALDSTDTPYICYHSYSTTGGLRIAKFDGVNWNIETIDSTSKGDTGYYSCLDLDTNDNPHVVYCDFGIGYQMYASFDGSSWHKYHIYLCSGAPYSTLAVDSLNSPHVAFEYNDNELIYMHPSEPL